MAYDFKKLSDVQSSAEIGDNANILVEEEGVIKRVPKSEIIPNNIALKSDIPEIPDAVINPASAEVGQTIIVKVVDESGKPTEWECTEASKSVLIQLVRTAQATDSMRMEGYTAQEVYNLLRQGVNVVFYDQYNSVYLYPSKPLISAGIYEIQAGAIGQNNGAPYVYSALITDTSYTYSAIELS